MCKISVVMSVYNCEKYVGKTIESVINQTYSDWEFIIINDCSKDRSAEIIKSFNDPRIRFIDNEINRGQCSNLNYGISIAKGEYVARLDHDDLCCPERFEKQVKYMDSNTDVVLLGADMDYLIEGEIKKTNKINFLDYKEVAVAHTFFNYCFSHSSFFIRKKALDEHNIVYDERYVYAEDYNLLFQLLKVGKIDYLKEVLILYRVFPEQCTQIYGEELKNNEIDEIRCEYIDGLPLEYKAIIKKAYFRKLKTVLDYKQFGLAFEELLLYYGVTRDELVKLSGNKGLQRVWRDVYYCQERTRENIISYLGSRFRDTDWLIKHVMPTMIKGVFKK